jgi:hypothetical protein
LIISNDNNVAAPKVPNAREQRKREKRRNHRHREDEKRKREESSSDDDIAIDVEDPQTRQGFCSFFCNCAAEIRGYCCEHFELRVVKVFKQQGKKPVPQGQAAPAAASPAFGALSSRKATALCHFFLKSSLPGQQGQRRILFQAGHIIQILVAAPVQHRQREVHSDSQDTGRLYRFS